MIKNILISFTIFLLLFPFGDAQRDEDYIAVLSNGRWCRFSDYSVGREKSSIVFPGFQKDNIPFFPAEWKEDDVKKVMTAVADWQINNFEKVKHHPLDWTNAALYIGMMSWAKIADTSKYLNWLYHIGQKYHWQPYFRMYHADDLAVTQMYLDMYRLKQENDDNAIIIQAKNPLADSRDHETLTLSWSKLSSSIKGLTKNNVAVLDLALTRYLVTQVFKSDDKSKEELLFWSSFGPKETKYFAVLKRPENIVKPTTKEKAFAMFVPQRMDDFAWENDRVAFRMYGPALENEMVSSSIDVWVKSVTYPVIKKRYANGNYHEDHGDGLDFYKVGQSRGCGGIAITKDGDEFVSRNFRKWKIIANGPIRVVFELYYNPYDVGGIQVKETKRIQLDMGSNMNLIKSSLSWKGNNSLNVRVGISRQDEGGQIKYELKDGILLYWPKANPEHGIIGCGLIVPDAKCVIDDNKNVYLSKKIKQGSTLKYYSGACWNKVKEFNDITKWENYLYHFKNLVNNPIEINYIK